MERTFPDPSEVTEQLERLVDHHFLRQSHRLVLFLRYIVSKTIRGEGDQLKERNVGTEVFGKGSRYDPATDSTVRVAASELRKRLALYYLEPEHARELRFSIPVGTYTPTFHWPSMEEEGEEKVDSEPQGATTSGLATETVPATEAPPLPSTSRFPWLRAGIAVVVLAILTSALLLRNRYSHDQAIDSFWGPLLHSNKSVLVLVAGHVYPTMYVRDAENPARKSILDMSGEQGINTVTLDDMQSLIIITGFLSEHHVPYEVRDESQVTISDLRNGPVVLIGAFCNSWALRLLKPLRFHFANDPSMATYWIEDSKSNSQSRWIVNRQRQLATNDFVDYAIVGRYKDDNLGQPVVIVSSIGGSNNINAAAVLTGPGFLSKLFDSTNKGRSAGNFEVVISAESVNGHSGEPRIEASYSW
jgi:hypothetical protein